MKGRKPKSREQRIREGNPGNRPLPRPVHFDPEGILMNKELERPQMEAAKEMWDVLVPILRDAGVLDTVDSFVLDTIVTMYARFTRARELVNAGGVLMRDEKTGKLYVNPAVRLERETALALNKIAENYGLTPLARTRLGLAEAAKKSLQGDLASRYQSARPALSINVGNV